MIIGAKLLVNNILLRFIQYIRNLNYIYIYWKLWKTLPEYKTKSLLQEIPGLIPLVFLSFRTCRMFTPEMDGGPDIPKELINKDIGDTADDVRIWKAKFNVFRKPSSCDIMSVFFLNILWKFSADDLSWGFGERNGAHQSSPRGK